MEPPGDDELTELLDEARHEQARRERSRVRWLRQQATEEARLTGLLVDAAERGGVLQLTTVAGARHRGRVTAVGHDFCAVTTAAGEVLVRLGAVTVVRPEPGTRPPLPQGGQKASVDLTLGERLARDAPEQPAVVVSVLGDREGIAGRLVAVGLDVVTVATPPRTTLVYVPLSAVLDVSLRTSG